VRGLYSCFLPGSGQLVGGARKRGYAFLGVVVAVLIAFVLVILLAVEDLDEFSAWLLEPRLLLALLIVDIALLLFRLYAVVDAVWLSRSRWSAVDRPSGEAAPETPGAEGSDPGPTGPSGGPWWRMPAVVAGLVLLLGFTAFPHVWVGYQYVYKSYDVLTTVFVDETTTSTTLPPTTTLGTGYPTSTLLQTTTTTVPAAAVNAGDDQRLTILFTGSDAGVGRAGARADTNIVASFDLNTGWIVLFSIPRNTGDAPLSEAVKDALGMRYYSNWLTGLYGSARRHPELAPEGGDPGAVAMRDTISLILGIPIDYYAVVDMLGLVNLVDTLGGVDVYFDEPLHMSISPPTKEEETLVYDVEEGVNHLDGRMALAYARTRHDSSDYVRMGRQRCLIAALMAQTGMTELVWNFPGIMDVVKKMVRTDIPIDALQQLVKLRSSLKTDEMISMGFTPPKYTNGLNDNQLQLGWILDYELIQATVKKVLENPEAVLAEAKDTGLDTGDCWKAPEEQ
jgi:LCP family protein required for cell wall assembly